MSRQRSKKLRQLAGWTAFNVGYYSFCIAAFVTFVDWCCSLTSLGYWSWYGICAGIVEAFILMGLLIPDTVIKARVPKTSVFFTHRKRYVILVSIGVIVALVYLTGVYFFKADIPYGVLIIPMVSFLGALKYEKPYRQFIFQSQTVGLGDTMSWPDGNGFLWELTYLGYHRVHGVQLSVAHVRDLGGGCENDVTRTPMGTHYIPLSKTLAVSKRRSGNMHILLLLKEEISSTRYFEFIQRPQVGIIVHSTSDDSVTIESVRQRNDPGLLWLFLE